MPHKMHDLITCTTAVEFLETMRPHNWVNEGDNWNIDWIFRGLGDEDYPLVPSAWRWKYDTDYLSKRPKTIMDSVREEVEAYVLTYLTDKKLNSENMLQAILGNKNRSRLVDVVSQAYAEHLMVRDFREMLNRFGLPSGTYYFEEQLPAAFVATYLIDLAQLVSMRHPDMRWFHTSIALAQHHRIPTRLLDWTRDPIVACFFAAQFCREGAKNISVFCTRKFNLYRASPIGVLDVPFELSAYIKSQAGLFTVSVDADIHYLDTGNFPRLFDTLMTSKTVTLPVSEVDELRRLLWLDNKTLASMMPTVDNIVTSLEFKWDAEY